VLNFETGVEPPKEVNVLPSQKGPTELEKLQEALDKMSKRLEGLEASLKEKETNHPDRSQPTRGRGNWRPSRNSRQPWTQVCWLCGELGPFQCDCYLNYSRPAQPVGGWPRVNDDHQLHSDTPTINVNTVLCTEGFANHSLTDSGAAVSVARLRSLSDEDHKAITNTKSSAVSANGTPLDVKGQIKLMISIGSFICEHTFIVICDLTVDCLLGADFLKKHEAVIDCKNGTLLLGTHIVPIHTGQQTTSSQVDSAVVVISTQEIPGRMV